ncbi:MAG: hypothetical protein HZB18_09835 [Chloroflexi bacterium]|nr:hypothetical protein [Chloroflexota bacterium]
MVYSWGHTASMIIFIGVALLLSRQIKPDAYRNFYHILEPLFPLMMTYLFTNIILKEQHQRTLALSSVTQFSLPFIFSIRLLLTILFTVSLIVIMALIINTSPPPPADYTFPLDPSMLSNHWAEYFPGDSNDVPAILLTFGPPILLLAGIGTTLAHITADIRTGNFVVFCIWFLNRSIGLTLDSHPLFQYVYFFARSVGTNEWIAPKIFQLFLGIAFLAWSWLLLHKPERLLRNLA